jgi:hypothetical protein
MEERPSDCAFGPCIHIAQYGHLHGNVFSSIALIFAVLRHSPPEATAQRRFLQNRRGRGIWRTNRFPPSRVVGEVAVGEEMPGCRPAQ